MKTARKTVSAQKPQPAAVLTEAVLRTSKLLALSNSELARILGVSDSSVSRLLAHGRQIDPASKEGELALLLVRLYRSLDALVGGDKDQRLAWLRSNNRALNGRPADLIGSAAGLVNTVAYLDSARATL
jgi:plasmid maintenance system antidote protein VapI